ncbi:MAG: lecithin retinol acyltransferase family protein [Acidimicrobiales bacterium]
MSTFDAGDHVKVKRLLYPHHRIYVKDYRVIDFSGGRSTFEKPSPTGKQTGNDSYAPQGVCSFRGAPYQRDSDAPLVPPNAIRERAECRQRKYSQGGPSRSGPGLGVLEGLGGGLQARDLVLVRCAGGDVDGWEQAARRAGGRRPGPASQRCAVSRGGGGRVKHVSNVRSQTGRPRPDRAQLSDGPPRLRRPVRDLAEPGRRPHNPKVGPDRKAVVVAVSVRVGVDTRRDRQATARIARPSCVRRRTDRFATMAAHAVNSHDMVPPFTTVRLSKLPKLRTRVRFSSPARIDFLSVPVYLGDISHF